MNRRPKRTEEEPAGGSISDRRLLERFLDHSDENAFAELVSRYCGLVLGVCRRVLRDEHTAEDAFQATFLVLARRASRIRRRSSLAGWLYAVAYRTAVRAGARRHRRREEPLEDDVMATDDTLAEVTSRYEQQLVDEELHLLPPEYREPLVLRYLMGKSNKQVARELGLGLGVVEGRLKRGKDRLRLRLARRGVSLTVALAAVGASSTVAEAASVESLVAATTEAAAAFHHGAKPIGTSSKSAIRLAEKELAMTTSTITTTSGAAAVLVIAGLALALGGDGGLHPAEAQDSTLAAVAEELPGTSPGGAGSGAESMYSGMGEDEMYMGMAPSESRDRWNEAARRWAELAKTGTVDMKQWSAAETRIRAALEESTEIAFIEAPLQDVVDFLKDQHAIEIQVDQRALDDVGIGTDTPITRNLKGLSLCSALRLILRDLDLTYVVAHDVLMITTPDVADTMVDTRVYVVRHLCDFESDSLAEVIRSTIRPETWRADASPQKPSSDEESPPETTRRAAIAALPGCLVITQTQDAHDEILDLLRQLGQYHPQFGMMQADTDE